LGKRPRKFFDNLAYEKDLWQKGIKFVAGVDEAGRGPWAGPVVAAAVIFPEDIHIEGIKDSKALSPKKREEFSGIIREKALSFATGIVESDEIDSINILQATFSAMRKALEQLSKKPQFLLVDGNRRIPEVDIPQLAIIKGDTLSMSIIAAGILAKVTRDEIMLKYHEKFPEYGFIRHKGYGTREHEKRLKDFGPSELHRFSFSPVRGAKKMLGRWGEEKAVRFLRERGYEILGRNLRTRFGEVDILAENEGVVAFVEVKTRSKDTFGRGEEAVSRLKQKRLIKLAQQIINNNNMSGRSFRFDVLSINFGRDRNWEMELIKDAFQS
jgi:uncharacterized protein (TIGR00252 family)